MTRGAPGAARRLVPGGLVPAIVDALGRDLVGLYLYGSAVRGGFDAGVSDLDLIAVTVPAAADLDLPRLRAMHEAFVEEHPEWRDRVEVAYVGTDDLRRFRGSRSLAVISPGEPLHLRDDRLADWAANWYLVRHGGVAFSGPAPDAVFPEITHDEFVAAVVRYADEVAGRDRSSAQPGEVAYELLTLCRAIVLVRTGRPVSKQEAAAFVAERIPGAAPVLEAALAVRLRRGASAFETELGRGTAEPWIERLHEAVHAARP